jgi:hypothetical protein
MRLHSLDRCCLGLLVALSLAPLPALAAASSPGAATAAPSLSAMAEYRRALEAYTAARRKYEAQAAAYWNAIADKRRIRNAKRHGDKEILLEDYVLTQPPVYVRPPRPVDPSKPAANEPPRRAYVPVVADFLAAAAKHFDFVPQQPQSEIDYKRAYVAVAATTSSWAPTASSSWPRRATGSSAR